MQRERKILIPTTRRNNLEIRSKGDNSGATLVGYAAIFNSPSQLIGGFFYEVVKPGAFKKWLSDPNNDVNAYHEHEPEYLLGRRSNGTLRLEEDDTGLKVEIDLPNTTYGQDVVVSVNRGDLYAMSFGFNAVLQRWDVMEGYELRELWEVELYEVSTTCEPAYTDTEIALRSYRQHKEQIPPLEDYYRSLSNREKMLKARR